MENANSQGRLLDRSGGGANKSGFAAWHPRARRVEDCSIC